MNWHELRVEGPSGSRGLYMWHCRAYIKRGCARPTRTSRWQQLEIKNHQSATSWAIWREGTINRQQQHDIDDTNLVSIRIFRSAAQCSSFGWSWQMRRQLPVERPFRRPRLPLRHRKESRRHCQLVRQIQVLESEMLPVRRGERKWRQRQRRPPQQRWQWQ